MVLQVLTLAVLALLACSQEEEYTPVHAYNGTPEGEGIHVGVSHFGDQRPNALMELTYHPYGYAGHLNWGPAGDLAGIEGIPQGPPLLRGGNRVILVGQLGIEAFERWEGTPMWAWETPGDSLLVAPAALAEDGTVYAPGEDELRRFGRLYAIGPDGASRWTSELWARLSTNAVADGERSVFVAGYHNLEGGDSEVVLYSIHAHTGLVRWEARTPGVPERLSMGTAAVYVDVYDGNDRALWAVDRDTGQERWRVTGPQAAVVGLDGTVYAGGFEGLWALDPVDGSTLWQASADCLTPSIGADGRLYTACYREGGADGMPVYHAQAYAAEDGSLAWEAGEIEEHWRLSWGGHSPLLAQSTGVYLVDPLGGATNYSVYFEGMPELAAAPWPSTWSGIDSSCRLWASVVPEEVEE